MNPTRTAGLAAGAVVALVAGLASYTHMRQLAAAHGETWLAWLLPLSVDGLLVVASLVIVTARRGGHPAPVLAWLALVTGVLASLAANVANAGTDLVARLVAAWPPLAFAVCFELLLRLLRTQPGEPGEAAGAAGEPVVTSGERAGPAGVWTDPTPTRLDLPHHPHQPVGEPCETGEPSGDHLVNRARTLVATHGRIGRARLARELGCTEHQARQVLTQLDAERPTLTAIGGEPR